MKLSLNSELPRGVYTDLGGGPEFFIWCRAAESRARARRGAITRAWTLYGQAARSGDPYPAALVLCQRLGVALEDLGRLLAALESDRPWEALRAARLDDLDATYQRLVEDRRAARAAFRLPSVATLRETDFDPRQREAVVAAANATAGRWHRHLVECAAGWALLRRLAKAMRHGSPLLPRPLVLGPPGAGALGAGLSDRSDRWVLLVPSRADATARTVSTEYSMADLEDRTLRKLRQAGFDGVALARVLAGLHVTRLNTESKWALPKDALSQLPPAQRRALEAVRRG
jgi:hypothetical protein